MHNLSMSHLQTTSQRLRGFVGWDVSSSPVTSTSELSHVVHMDEQGVWPVVVTGAPIKICVLTGAVWVTLQGDPNDYVMREGDCFVSAPYGKMIVQALSETRLTIDSDE